MKELAVSPEELFFLGKLMKGRHLDYAYIAAMEDIQQYKVLHEQECRERLKASGMLEEDFWEELTVHEEASALLSPVFSGDFRSQAISIGKDGIDIDVRLHWQGERCTMAEMEGKRITLRAAGEGELERLVSSLTADAREHGIVLKNLNSSGQAVLSVYLARDGQVWEQAPDGLRALPAGGFAKTAMSILKGA